MRLFNIILLVMFVGGCTTSTDSAEESVDTAATTTTDTATADTTSDSTEKTEDVLVIDAVVVKPTDAAEEE